MQVQSDLATVSARYRAGSGTVQYEMPPGSVMTANIEIIIYAQKRILE